MAFSKKMNNHPFRYIIYNYLMNLLVLTVIPRIYVAEKGTMYNRFKASEEFTISLLMQFQFPYIQSV